MNYFLNDCDSPLSLNLAWHELGHRLELGWIRQYTEPVAHVQVTMWCELMLWVSPAHHPEGTAGPSENSWAPQPSQELGVSWLSKRLTGLHPAPVKLLCFRWGRAEVYCCLWEGNHCPSPVFPSSFSSLMVTGCHRMFHLAPLRKLCNMIFRPCFLCLWTFSLTLGTGNGLAKRVWLAPQSAWVPEVKSSVSKQCSHVQPEKLIAKWAGKYIAKFPLAVKN